MKDVLRHASVYLFGILLAGLSLADRADADPIQTVQVTLDTSALIGQGTFWLTFDLIDADDIANDTVTVSDVQINGGSLVSEVMTAGGAVGNLSTGVTLTDSVFFNSFSQAFMPGSALQFTLGLTLNSIGGTPDALAFLNWMTSSFRFRPRIRSEPIR